MGNPFKSKKKTAVGTSVSRVVEDALIPDPLIESLLATVITGDPFTTSVINSSLNNPVHRFERAFKYGQNGYVYGLPNTTLHETGKGVDEVKAAIDLETGLDVNIEYVEYSPINNTHMGWKWLMENGYNPSTNEIEGLSTLIGHDCYLDRVVRLYAFDEDMDPEEWQEWDNAVFEGSNPSFTDIRDNIANKPRSFYALNEKNLHEGVKIGFAYFDNANELQYGDHIIDLTEYDERDNFFQVKYSYELNNEIVYRYWIYEAGSGVYPDLDALYKFEYVNPGTYFPFIPFRKNLRNLSNHLAGTEELQSIRKMANKFGMDYDAINEAIHENSDVGYVVSATMMMGVPMKTEDPIERKYLFKFFLRAFLQRSNVQDIATASGNQGDEYEDFLVRAFNTTQDMKVRMVPPSRYAMEFKDAGLSYTLQFGNITRNTIARSGTVGEYDSEIVTIPMKKVSYTAGRSEDRQTKTEDVTIRCVVLRHQISPGLCDEIIIVNPTMVYDAYKKYKTTASATSKNLLIPIDRSIVHPFSLEEKNILYHRSLHIVFNSRKEYKEKWYQTGVFKVFLLVVAVAVVVVSFGYGTGPAAALVAAVTAGFTATMIFLLKLIIYNIIIRYAFRLVAKEIGIEVAIVLAVVAAVVAINVEFTGSPIFENGATTWADALLQLSSGLTVGSQLALEDAFEDVSNQLSDFNDYSEGRYEELKAAQDLLESGSLLDPLLLIERRDPLVIFGETPDNYFNRTVHSGNVGIAAYDLIENYVDISLKLPDVSQTLGVDYGT